jgi:hypothetical protein
MDPNAEIQMDIASNPVKAALKAGDQKRIIHMQWNEDALELIVIDH